jgi:D-xylose transport system substrate-binding protein
MKFSLPIAFFVGLVLFNGSFAPQAFAKAPKIGFILATMQEERYQKDKKAFLDAVKKAGGTVEFSSSNNSEQTQTAEVENLLSKGIDALVIQAVNGDTAASLVKAANKDGVPVVAYDRLIKNAPIAVYITHDSYKIGQLQAEAAVKATGGKGNYVILMGQAGHSVAETITAGVMDVLKKHPGITVVAKAYHNGWSPELAMKTTENALTKNKNNIAAILANNSGMAHGAVQALDEQKLTGKVFVAGSDADLSTIRNIVAGKMQLEILGPIEEIATKAANTAMALAQKKEFKTDGMIENGQGPDKKIKLINSQVFAIDKSNIDSRIIKAGVHTREAVYGAAPKSK